MSAASSAIVSARWARGRGTKNKLPVVSLVERGGRVRSVVMPKATADNLRAVLKEHVNANARVMTDDYPAYKGRPPFQIARDGLRDSSGF